MGKPTGFLEVERVDRGYEKPAVRKKSWKEFVKPLPEPVLRAQASRCMDCGIPFCHEGCPVNNLIPDWNNLVYRDQWRQALVTLHSTNNFPEFTGRICPAPCEASCTLNIDENPVTIKTIECAIVDRAWENGWLKPEVATEKTGKKVAVIGSGPAGLASAQQLARAGAADILAGGKHVVVIGGGDTGSDCIGTSFRQGAKSVTQLEIMPAPPEQENKGLTWPNWPLKMRTSSSQAEGAAREFAVLTQKFSGADGKVKKLHCVKVDDKFKPLPGTEFDLDAELVLLAMGFVHPVHEGLLKSLGVDLDQRGNVRANFSDYQTSLPKVFSAGDMRRGQSLVVWAIREGRLCARSIDTFLMGSTTLPR